MKEVNTPSKFYLEPPGRIGVVLVDVWVVLLGQVVVCLFDLLLRSVSGHTEDLVVVFGPQRGRDVQLPVRVLRPDPELMMAMQGRLPTVWWAPRGRPRQCEQCPTRLSYPTS